MTDKKVCVLCDVSLISEMCLPDSLSSVFIQENKSYVDSQNSLKTFEFKDIRSEKKMSNSELKVPLRTKQLNQFACK